MHQADPESSAPDTPQPDSSARTAAGRVRRMIAVVLGGALTGMLIGAPVGLIADAVGLPSGGSAAAAALAFLMIALSIRWLLLRATRKTAAVTSLVNDASDDEDIRSAA